MSAWIRTRLSHSIFAFTVYECTVFIFLNLANIDEVRTCFLHSSAITVVSQKQQLSAELNFRIKCKISSFSLHGEYAFRDETAVRLTVDQQFFTCCILATADWCAETTLQLQEKLKQGVHVSAILCCDNRFGCVNDAECCYEPLLMSEL